MKFKLPFLVLIAVLVLTPPIVFAGPKSASFELKDFTFGGGGTDKSSSSNYSLSGVAGEVEGGETKSTNYTIGEALNYTLQANVPPAPTFVNDSGSDYNKLKLTIDTGSNPADATFAIAISTDNFVSDTNNFVTTSNTIGSGLTMANFQTNATWGAAGFFIIGLTPGTTYYVKVSAMHGNFTQSAFGPVASAATSNVSLTFDIDVSASDSDTGSPYNLNMGDLSIGSVNTSSEKIWVDIDSNAINGAAIYTKDANAGLKSTVNSFTINSSTANLASVSSGYGLQGSTATQASGGPLTYVAPFNGASDNVGALTTSYQRFFDSTGAAIVGGRGSAVVKVKASTTTPASTDYSDIITLVATGAF